MRKLLFDNLEGGLVGAATTLRIESGRGGSTVDCVLPRLFVAQEEDLLLGAGTILGAAATASYP